MVKSSKIMKTVCLLASPRPMGNSTAIARHFADTIESLGSDIQEFALNKLKYRGCQACNTCKTKLDRCVLKDDLTQVLDAIRQTDILVLATPTYFGDVSSQLKACIDRMWSFFVPDYLSNPNPSRLSPGKKLIFIQTQGNPGENVFDDIFPRYEKFFRRFGFDSTYLIRTCGVGAPGEVESRKEIYTLANETAKELVNNK